MNQLRDVQHGQAIWLDYIPRGLINNSGQLTEEALSAHLIQPTRGEVRWLVDADAVARLARVMSVRDGRGTPRIAPV